MRLFSLATVGFLALAATAGASTPAAKPAAPAKPAWASGHLGSVDTATKSVVVKQGKHEMTFQLAPDATVTMGKTTIQAADLATDIGKPVKVRYTVNGASKLADRVEITEAAKPAATAKKK
jgi:hypothetical protein